MDLTSDQARIMEIMYPYAFERTKAVEGEGTRFVHYTRAEVAMSMIRSNEIWLRKASCMNDFMEVQHGLECLAAAYNSDRERIQDILNGLFEGTADKLEKYFNGWQDDMRYHTYIVCLSEHDDSEDDIGRLSMWRAYGHSTGVALVLNNTPFLNLSGPDALKAYASPVAYMSSDEFIVEFGKVVDAVEENADFLRQFGQETIFGHIFNAFKFAALSTKHPGFHEEREWRVIYAPNMAPSDYMKKSIEIISGAPQPVYKLPLQNVPDAGITGIEVPELLNRVIIGPTEFPLATYEAFVGLLDEAGVPNPEERVTTSSIPLR